ncbi:MAG: RIP metalloprotease RseP [Saprospiraceae bacterium]|nr:RIP metalloprotease RseP [Saprospiraceae bacterium]
MTGIPIMIIQLLLSLSFLVIIHECGHFFPAKWFKTRVEKFYLFFDPWFSLFKTKKGDTEYGIGWLPLGGYVKISGMVDESFDTEKLKEEPKPYEFRSKPAWQRLIIMLGGVTVNFIAGFLLFAFVLGKWGEEYLPTSAVQNGIYTDSLGRVLGLRDGDKIVKVGDHEFVEFDNRMLKRGIVINGAKTITVERDGQVIDLVMEDRFIQDLSNYKYKNEYLIGPRVPIKVAGFPENSPSQNAGLEVGDEFLTINGQPARFANEFYPLLKASKNLPLTVKVKRAGGEEKEFTFTANPDGTIGAILERMIKTERRKYGFFEAIPAGVNKGLGFLGDQIKAFGQMFRGKIKASESLGGFASITSLFPDTWQWEDFIRITAILSLILGFMNLLPIPGLDGGHVLFLLFEMVTGKKLSDKFVEQATMVGFVLLIALMIYANGLDVFRFLKK